MKPGGAGIRAVREWTGIVADRYYRLAEQAIRAADPDALYFGDRLPIYYDPAAVRAMAPHVDAIATNYNVDSGDGWIADYFFDGLRKLSGGKPALVSEWFFAARENRTGQPQQRPSDDRRDAGREGCRRRRGDPQLRGHSRGRRSPLVPVLRPPKRWPRPTARITILDWWTSMIGPTSGSPLALSAANRPRSRSPRECGGLARAAAARLVLPHASISVDDRSLSDWPKPASLLPRLNPSPGAVEFGEAYLSWSEQGLALATIGQDYFDIDLLAYDGRFPLVEAYRVEFGRRYRRRAAAASRCSSSRRGPSGTTTRKWPRSFAPALRQ